MGARLSNAARWAREQLPEGSLLPDAVWLHRHRVVLAVAFSSSALLFALALQQGLGVWHSLVDSLPVAAFAGIALPARLGRKARAAAASAALITAAAMLTHVWSGQIEAHFAFFVALGLLTVYQDWVPFLMAIGYVILHHGLLGAFDPNSVYSHAAGREQPWKWAVIHGAFVLAACAANLLCWRISEQALREPLTGLAGRGLLLHRLARVRSERRRVPVAVLFLDLDQFKVLNDSRGHGAGDELLVAVAERLRASARTGDTVARMGGDEFALLCPEIATAEAASAVAERLREAVRQPYVLQGESFATSVSIGIVLARGDESPEQLLAEADAAMYEAKEQGGDACVVYDGAMRAGIIERHELERDLRRALAHSEIAVEFQPIVDLADDRTVGLEALARWRHPEHGQIAPTRFIPVAEACGLIEPLGERVLREACRAIADRAGVFVSVNLSARQVARPGLVAMVASALADAELDPRRLCLEITESVLLESSDHPHRVLAELKRLGVTIALDDFGTGYSSLSYLKRMPIDIVKIDRHFIGDLGEHESDDAIVRAVLAMASSLGITVVAEGVETAAQAARLRLLGCELAQGYYFARPNSLDRVGIAGENRAWQGSRVEAVLSTAKPDDAARRRFAAG